MGTTVGCEKKGVAGAQESVALLLENALFGFPRSRVQKRLWWGVWMVLFAVGVIHWIGFFNAGNLTLAAADWVKEDIYLDTAREAIRHHAVPWQWDTPFYHGTVRVMSNPECLMAPHLLLLNWIPNRVFVLLHILVLYLLGLAGSIVLARDQRWGVYGCIVFWLLFNFNGFITSHLATGHFQWSGYLLLPWFILLYSRIMDRCETGESSNRSLEVCMALVIAVMIFNGSVHVAVWCMAFMFLAALWQWTALMSAIRAALLVGALCFGRLLPALLWFPEKTRFLLGYPSLGSFLDALTLLREHGGVVPHVGFAEPYTWEYNLFVGFVGCLLLVVGVGSAIRHRVYRMPLLWASIVMGILSMGQVYAFWGEGVMPFPGIIRAPARFMALPLVYAVLLAATGMSHISRSGKNGYQGILLLSLPLLTGELLSHSLLWRIARFEWRYESAWKPVVSLVPCSDRVYMTTVAMAWTASLVAWLATMTYLWTQRQTGARCRHV